jgi:hypothetical protein
VRSISGTAATKAYRCPGCDQEIPAGTPHVVAWPAGDGAERSSTLAADEPEGTGSHAAERSWDAGGGSPERRHWHTRCWQRRR